MDLSLAGRAALVTGASKGLGLGIARALAAEGAHVAVSSRSRKRIDAAAEEIGARAYMHDNSDLDSASDLVQAVEADLGPLDILVANTGGPPPGADPLGFTRAQWEAAYRSLVLAPMALVERVLPGMRERGFGRVLAVSSSAVPWPPSSARSRPPTSPARQCWWTGASPAASEPQSYSRSTTLRSRAGSS